jgi:hypothetical protein
MSTEDVEKSIKVVMFDCKPSNWIVWKEKWSAVAFRKGYGQPYRYQDICEYCRRPVHCATHCNDRQRASGDAGTVVFGVGDCTAPPSTDAASPNFSLMMVSCDTLSTGLVANTLVNKYLWIAAYGASSHMTCSNDRMFDCHNINDQIKISDGTFIKAITIGSKNVLVKQPDGKMAKVTISNVKYVHSTSEARMEIV